VREKNVEERVGGRGCGPAYVDGARGEAGMPWVVEIKPQAPTLFVMMMRSCSKANFLAVRLDVKASTDVCNHNDVMNQPSQN
jgi:hypothetical protein